ncbi:hypothetical protein CBA19CS22_38520 [Caballeronia novacaledonica]|uniref:Uncharacterized protein n=1 Tax=Caballeronia novacaledonica TaxID=1544861 RepID=A0ACB5R661_9BURK|nr:LysR family transcriptional regulator [Caballeronia sp. LZ029]MDR5748859.1 LysR family transcriptional regulator [Caballeronia sp. LZ029]GJH22568.1 hypothetical protein CBA19CS22_38520 [Caballeronia novacaledonica]
MSYGPSEIKLIRVFAGVVQNRGFAAAQEKLNLSVSAISTYMSQLEELVGVTLCHRGRGGFRLTEKGRLFYAEVEALLDRLDSFETYTLSLRSDLGGSLDVGLTDSIASDPTLPLARVIREFVSLHPKVRLSLYVANPYELQNAVIERRIDLAIGTLGDEPCEAAFDFVGQLHRVPARALRRTMAMSLTAARACPRLF